MTTTKFLLWFVAALLPISLVQLTGGADVDEEELVDVVVGFSTEKNSTFRSHEGRRYLSQFNVRSRLKRVNAISMRVRASDVYKLEQDPDVLYVEEDVKMYLLSDPTPEGVERSGNKVPADERAEELLPQQDLRSLQNKNKKKKRKENKKSISKVNDAQRPGMGRGEVTPWGISAVHGGGGTIPNPKDSDGCFKICIIDTGLRVEHPDIPFRRGDGRIEGETFGLRYGQTWYNPPRHMDHGTHVTGTVIAAGNNGFGVKGVISDSRNFCMMHARVFGYTSRTYQFKSVVDRAAEWCADGGARVINMSLGYDKSRKSSQELYKKLNEEGIMVIAAAGNRGGSDYAYPASYEDVVSVAAVDENLRRTYFSRFNLQVDVCAPGRGIYSTVMNLTRVPNSRSQAAGLSYYPSYARKSGTSMACAHVTGVAAKIWAVKPNCTNVQVREALQNTARDLNKDGTDSEYGHGLVQAYRAYKYLDYLGC